MHLDDPPQTDDAAKSRPFFMMKPWQVKIFVILFRPLPFPKWVIGGNPRLADVIMLLCGLAAGILRYSRPIISHAFLACAISIGVLMLIWHMWVHTLIEQRMHRILHGLCLNCGYDLRATLAQCPECGQLPEKES